MKKHIAKISLLTLCAAAILVAPASSRAQDVSTNAPAAEKTAPAKKRTGIATFHGSLTAVDTGAMTITVDSKTLQITSETKITKDGKPAVLADGVVGETVGGTYKKAEGGKLNAVTVHFGAKAAKPKNDAAAGN